MCCFSGQVQRVAGTRIFARLDGARQALVYSMTFAAANDVAMLLPVPVPPKSAEDAVKFVSLEGYPKLFEALDALYPRSKGEGRGLTDSAPPQRKLQVHDVGAFEASFVPSLGDMDRLDERFRMPAGAWDVLARRRPREQAAPKLTQAEWDALPDYRDWGFCVFKLKASADAKQVHPMAFTFPTRHADRVFFPTVHVHDGSYPLVEEFDHELFLQVGAGALQGAEADAWEESPGPASAAVDTAKARGLVAADDHVYRRRLRGERPNRDQVVATA